MLERGFAAQARVEEIRTDQVGAQQEAIAAQPLQEQLARYQFGQQLPYQQLQGYLSSVYGTPLGSYGTQTTNAPTYQNRGAGVLGGAIAGGLGGYALGQIPGVSGFFGNQLSKSILDASPETVKELQNAYADMEATSNHGVDALAKSMSTFGNLATEELNQAYTQAQSDLKSALADQAKEYLTAQAEINTAFNKAMTDAEATRDTAIASAQADLAEALAEENKNFAEAVAEINSDLMESLAEAEKDFVEASNQARKDLEDSLTAIEKEFKDKLGKITDATKATNKEITNLLANFNSTKKILETPIIIPAPVYAAGSGGGGGGSSSSSSSTTKTATTNITTNVTANTNASPTAIAGCADVPALISVVMNQNWGA